MTNMWKHWCKNGCGKTVFHVGVRADNRKTRKWYQCTECKEFFRKDELG